MTSALIVASASLARLPACAAIAAAKGADAPYVADAAVRAYQQRHVAELARDLGLPGDPATELTIVAGIGTLTLRWHGNTFVPAARTSPATPVIATGAATSAPAVAISAPPPAPRPADPAVIAQRRAHCAGCVHHDGQRCRVAGCACAGLGVPEHRSSRCPVGRW